MIMRLTMWILIICCYGITFINAQGDRVAPGVPPQHYQQYQQVPSHVPTQHGQHVPQQQVHQQQMQMQQQHVPVQQQHVPVQQQHVPIQQQHVPVQNHVPNQQQPHGHHHGEPQKILNAANVAHEKDHIKEHMEVPMDTSKMSDQELQFHYFKMHDADNNNKLDGCELIKSLIHWHEHGGKDPNSQKVEERIFSDEELISLIDPILTTDDSNVDGFIDYPEFIQAQQKSQGQKPNQ